MRWLPSVCLVRALSAHVCSPSWQHARMVRNVTCMVAILSLHAGHTCRQVWHQRVVHLQGEALPETLSKTFNGRAGLARGGSFGRCRFARDGSAALFTAVNCAGDGHLLRWEQARPWRAALLAGPHAAARKRAICSFGYYGLRTCLPRVAARICNKCFTAARCTGEADWSDRDFDIAKDPRYTL